MFVGIDVSEDRLDVHLRPSGEAFAVPRDDAGTAALTERLASAAPTLVVLEATGGFEITVAAGIAGAGLPLAVVNPAQIRAFARATGRLAKTDRLDAAAIAHFAEAVRPAPRPLASEAVQGLAELVGRRRRTGRDDRHGDEPPPDRAQLQGAQGPRPHHRGARGRARRRRPRDRRRGARLAGLARCRGSAYLGARNGADHRAHADR